MRIWTLQLTSLAGFATSAVLAGGAIWITARGLDLPAFPGTFGNGTGEVRSPSATTLSPAAAYAFEEALKRPLFEETRRPFSKPSTPVTPEPLAMLEPASAPPAMAPDLSGFRLAGVYLSGTQQAALIVTPDNPQGQWIKRGEGIGGWTLGHISPGHVTLEASGQSNDLQLYVEDSAKSVDQPE